MIPQGMSSTFTPACINPSTKWLHAIDDFDCLEDHQYSAWQEFIFQYGTAVEIKSDEWLEGTLLLSMEATLRAEVESDLKGLPMTHRGALTMLRFIIKRLVVHNQEAWDALKIYVKTFDIRNFPGENVPTACLKLKAVLSVLGNKTPSNAVRTILEGFALDLQQNISRYLLPETINWDKGVLASLGMSFAPPIVVHASLLTIILAWNARIL